MKGILQLVIVLALGTGMLFSCGTQPNPQNQATEQNHPASTPKNPGITPQGGPGPGPQGPCVSC